MSLDELTASDLARIDSVCLEYETQYRRGNAPEINEVVARFIQLNSDPPSRAHAELLRTELELVRDELQSDATIDSSGDQDRSPGSGTFRIPKAGTRLGPYIVGKTIGRGGMGVVLEAVDQRLNRKVAIKMLATEIASRGNLTERFEREAKSVATISHPNVVELFDVGIYNGLPYAVMEYLDGELLSDRLKRERPSIDETRQWGAQIADALAKSHHAGVIHRDLKPQNVMLVPCGENDSPLQPAHEKLLVKLFDYGLSRLPRDYTDENPDDTQEGVILGTPGYMAPEQALGEPATAAADIFALGCILFESFYGKRAFEGATKIQRHRATLTDQPDPDPFRRRDDLELATLIDQCLAKEPSQRPRSAALIAKRLRQRETEHELVQKSMRSGQRAGQFTRRRIFELFVGGTAGGAVAAYLGSRDTTRLSQIKSLAVLSFSDDSQRPALVSSNVSQQPDSAGGSAVGRAGLRPGEELAAMLVHELTRIPSLVVLPFRPLVATTPKEYQRLGELLSVDALLDGRLGQETQGTKKFLRLDVRMVSAENGTQLDGFVIHADAEADFLQQSRFAEEIAQKIGRRLTSTATGNAPPTAQAFHCLVDGKVRCDPDSRSGLEMALKCFTKAHAADIRFAPPLAGLALTSIMLAAQSSADRSVALIEQARERSADALQRDKNSVDARLAVAMLDWQTVEQYATAETTLVDLLKQAPNNWQIHHQLGLLKLAVGRIDEAIESLRAATLRNPLSITVKTDLARAHWFQGDVDRAIDDALRIRQKFNHHDLAVGLLIDIYEQQQQFAKAAELQSLIDAVSLESYFSQRSEHLLRLPYGPFGDELNRAIFKSRSPGGIENIEIADLADAPMPPMLSLILANHPSFEAARKLPRSKEILARLGQTV